MLLTIWAVRSVFRGWGAVADAPACTTSRGGGRIPSICIVFWLIDCRRSVKFSCRVEKWIMIADDVLQTESMVNVAYKYSVL